MIAERPGKLAVADVDGVHTRSTSLEKAIGESTSGCADIGADPTLWVNRKGLESSGKLFTTTADVGRASTETDVSGGGYAGGGFDNGLVIYKDIASHDEALGQLARGDKATLDEEDIEALFFDLHPRLTLFGLPFSQMDAKVVGTGHETNISGSRIAEFVVRGESDAACKSDVAVAGLPWVILGSEVFEWQDF